jgi:hypothetical protein
MRLKWIGLRRRDGGVYECGKGIGPEGYKSKAEGARVQVCPWGERGGGGEGAQGQGGRGGEEGEGEEGVYEGTP